MDFQENWNTLNKRFADLEVQVQGQPQISGPYKINILEKCCTKSGDCSVSVSFWLPGHDWYELQQSVQWKAVEKFLTHLDSITSLDIPQRGMVNMKCPNCGNTNITESHNFCEECGTKLRRICNCWVKKGSYDCGYDNCPGYALSRLQQRDI